MKKNTLYILGVLIASLLTSCSDWLDVVPKDRVPKDKQYETEDGIHSALNGIYRQFADADLYGAQLTGTTLDLMGHFYAYATDNTNDSDAERIRSIATFEFTASDAVKTKFANIWTDAYKAILNINDFIDGVTKSSAVLPAGEKDLLIGEALGLRAYLCFDLYRLFAPYNAEASKKVLPYATDIDIELNHNGYEEDVYKTSAEYTALLLQDIADAASKLANDPIITDAESITNTLVEGYFKNRNRRMNYYAVKALEARVLQYTGNDAGAVQAAKVITDLVDANKRFTWADPTTVTANSNYILFSEVLFGVNNLNFSSMAKEYYLGTLLTKSYVVEHNNLIKNIYAGYPEELTGIADFRVKQWRQSHISSSAPFYPSTPNYMSLKFESSSAKIPAITNLQVLMRISEMYYIQAEAALRSGNTKDAVEILNKVLTARGLTEQYYLPSTANATAIRDHVTREYYREFYSEGQVYFYHKRLQNSRIFDANAAGTIEVDPAKAYVVPIPQIETDI